MFKVKNEDEWKKNYIIEFNQMRVDYEEKLQRKQLEIESLKKQIQEMKESKNSLKPREKQISDKDINKIKAMRGLGMSYREIERNTKWSKATISRVLNGLYDVTV